MNVVKKLLKDWGNREVYPITEEEFYSLLSDYGNQTWTKKNMDNGDGTFTNELKIGDSMYLIVTQKTL